MFYGNLKTENIIIILTLRCDTYAACFQDLHMKPLLKSFSRHSKIINVLASRSFPTQHLTLIIMLERYTFKFCNLYILTTKRGNE